MRPELFAVPVVMLFAAGAAGSQALAASISAAPPGLVSEKPIIEVHGCHNRTHVGYVAEWGVTTAHHHAGSDCAPVQDENDVPRYHHYQGPSIYFNFDDNHHHHHDHNNDHNHDHHHHNNN
jgi:hypothetical protein